MGKKKFFVKGNAEHLAALRIAVIYLVIGTLWITLSDKIVSHLTTNTNVLTQIQTVKGWLYILITAWLFYLLIRDEMRGRKRSEEIIKEREENYRSLFESSDDAIYVLQNDKLVRVNHAWEKMFGYTLEEAASDDFDIYDIIAPSSRDFIAEKLKRNYDEAPAASRYEMQGISKEEIIIDLEVSVTKISWNGKKAFQGIYRDITGRKKTEEALRREAFIFDNLYDAVIISDLEGKVLNWNSAAVRMYGYEKDEVLYKSVGEVLNDKDEGPKITKEIIKTVEEKGWWSGEINFIRKNGNKRISDTTVFPYRDLKGEKIALVGVNRDITERKIIEKELIRAKEKAEESDRLKSEFLAQMSHEIRSPLNVILSYNSFLKEELGSQLNEDFESSFTAIDSAGRRLLRTIDLILNMAALQSGNVEVKLSPIDLVSIISVLVKEFIFSAANKNIKLSLNVKTEETKILSDDYIVIEIFQNLISNAVKYTLEGEIEIIIYNNFDGKLCVDVKDTGIGISKEFLQKIFMPFTQEETGYSRSYEGNGLGLALVKNYVALINADIKVESKKGVGSVFTVIFSS
ncbi:MAG: sensor histidine kinase [Ignavibacteriaceae bacterium]